MLLRRRTLPRPTREHEVSGWQRGSRVHKDMRIPSWAQTSDEDQKFITTFEVTVQVANLSVFIPVLQRLSLGRIETPDVLVGAHTNSVQ